jgi:hypothetical protein
MSAPGARFSRYSGEDDVVHPHDGVPRFNESVFVNFVGADDSPVLGGVLRVGLRPVEEYSDFHVCLVLADGTALYGGSRKVPLDDFVAGGTAWRSGPLAIEVVEPGRVWQITYDSADTRHITDSSLLSSVGRALKASQRVACRVSLRFEATRPIHTMSESGEMIPGEEAAKDHYEQFGRIGGEVAWGHQSATLDGLRGFRDHSWGPRNYVSAMADMDWFTGHLPGGVDLVGFDIRSRPDLPHQGVVIDDAGRAYVDSVHVDAPWDVEQVLAGTPALRVDAGDHHVSAAGSVDQSFVIRHRSDAGVVHNSFSLVRYETPDGVGRGWLDLSRPGPPAPASP